MTLKNNICHFSDLRLAHQLLLSTSKISNFLLPTFCSAVHHDAWLATLIGSIGFNVQPLSFRQSSTTSMDIEIMICVSHVFSASDYSESSFITAICQPLCGLSLRSAFLLSLGLPLTLLIHTLTVLMSNTTFS